MPCLFSQTTLTLQVALHLDAPWFVFLICQGGKAYYHPFRHLDFIMYTGISEYYFYRSDFLTAL